MTSILRASTLTLAGVGMVTAGMFAATSVHAQETDAETERPVFERFAERREAHKEHVAEALGVTIDELQDMMSTRKGRQDVHEQMRTVRGQKRAAHKAEVAEQLGITVEELEAAKADPEARAAIRAQMEELGIEPPHKPGHRHAFGNARLKVKEFRANN